jgi:hypothetical protein
VTNSTVSNPAATATILTEAAVPETHAHHATKWRDPLYWTVCFLNAKENEIPQNFMNTLVLQNFFLAQCYFVKVLL